MDEAFSYTLLNCYQIFKLALHSDCLLTILLILYAFSEKKKKKSFNSFCSMTRCIIILKNNFNITKPIFYLCNEKIIQVLHVNNCIDCWDNHELQDHFLI